MITINLLSPQQKKDLDAKRIFIIIKKLIMLFLLFASIVAVILISARYILEQQLTSLLTQNATQIQASREINEQIIIVNRKIKNAEKIQTDFVKWSNLLIWLSDQTPEDITYNSIKISYADTILNIKGIAKNRQDLVKFKEKLEESEMLSNVSLPLHNLLAKEDNVFDIEAEINLKTNE